MTLFYKIFIGLIYLLLVFLYIAFISIIFLVLLGLYIIIPIIIPLGILILKIVSLYILEFISSSEEDFFFFLRMNDCKLDVVFEKVDDMINLFMDDNRDRYIEAGNIIQEANDRLVETGNNLAGVVNSVDGTVDILKRRICDSCTAIGKFHQDRAEHAGKMAEWMYSRNNFQASSDYTDEAMSELQKAVAKTEDIGYGKPNKPKNHDSVYDSVIATQKKIIVAAEYIRETRRK